MTGLRGRVGGRVFDRDSIGNIGAEQNRQRTLIDCFLEVDYIAF